MNDQQPIIAKIDGDHFERFAFVVADEQQPLVTPQSRHRGTLDPKTSNRALNDSCGAKSRYSMPRCRPGEKKFHLTSLLIYVLQKSYRNVTFSAY